MTVFYIFSPYLYRFDKRRGGTPLARVSRSRGAERERGERRGGGEKGREKGGEEGRERRGRQKTGMSATHLYLYL